MSPTWPPRVLQVHKFFFPHAGSESSLFSTRDLLARRGHEIVDFSTKSPDNLESAYDGYFSRERIYQGGGARKFRDAAATVYSTEARRQLSRLLDETRPDVAHLHLISHQLTMSVVDELARRDVPMAMTLHDYKIACPAYIAFRDGHSCTDCASGSFWNAVVHACHKGSRGASLMVALEAQLARSLKKWEKVDHFIAPSAFAGEIAVRAGAAPDKVSVVPNFIETERLAAASARPESTRRDFFYAGRLETVKGVRTLLDAFTQHDLGERLIVAGAGGTLEPEVAEISRTHGSIEFLGRRSREEVMEVMRGVRAVVVPSIWDENNPLSLLEARAAGAPVVATRVGGLPEMVTDGVDGFLCEPDDVPGLTHALRTLVADDDLVARMGRAGLERLARDNSEDVHYERLIAAYRAASRNRSSR